MRPGMFYAALASMAAAWTVIMLVTLAIAAIVNTL
jgi:hypothetical protein